MDSKHVFFLVPALLVSALLLAPARVPADNTFVLDRVAAVVNKDVITMAEFYRAMQFDYAPQMKSLSGEEKRAFLKKHEAGYLDKMIDMALQLQDARKQKLEVNDRDIDDAIDSIRKKYSMDEKTFEEALKKEGFTLSEYRQRLSEQILVSKVVAQDVKDKISVSRADVDAYIKRKGLKADGNGEEFKLSQIFFRMPEDPAQKPGVEKKADEALARINAGGDFTEVAKKYSEADPEIGTLKRGLLSNQMLSLLDKMKPGDVSKPFWTDRGLYILKLDDRTSGGPQDLREMVKKKLFNKEFGQAYKTWLRDLRENSYIEVRL